LVEIPSKHFLNLLLTDERGAKPESIGKLESTQSVLERVDLFGLKSKQQLGRL
jgi:hypothetical protein